MCIYMSSFPITVDDIASATKMEEIAVSFFNAAGHTTVAGGTIYPRGTVVLSSNKSFVESDRYIIIHYCANTCIQYKYIDRTEIIL